MKLLTMYVQLNDRGGSQIIFGDTPHRLIRGWYYPDTSWFTNAKLEFFL